MSKNDIHDPTEGLEEIANIPKKLNDIHGVEFEIPVPSWKAELAVVKAIGTIMSKVRETTQIDFSQMDDVTHDTGKMNDVVIEVVNFAPNEITKIVATILNKEIAFVENDLDLDIILSILVPFLLTRWGKIAKRLSTMETSFAPLMQGLRGSSSTQKTPRTKRS